MVVAAVAATGDAETMADATLRAWLDREQEILARLQQGPGPGVSQPAQVLPLSGLALLRAMLDGQLPYAHMSKTLDYLLVEVNDGHAVFQGTPGEAFLNPMGTVHGGWYATLLDSALACAVHSKLPAGRGYTTAQLNVNLVKAIGPKVSRVRAEARAVHSGRQLATAEGRLFGPDGTVYAHATTTCLVFDLPGK